MMLLLEGVLPRWQVVQKENRCLCRAAVAQRWASHLFPVVAGNVPILIYAFWERENGHKTKSMVLVKIK